MFVCVFVHVFVGAVCDLYVVMYGLVLRVLCSLVSVPCLKNVCCLRLFV